MKVRILPWPSIEGEEVWKWLYKSRGELDAIDRRTTQEEVVGSSNSKATYIVYVSL